MDRAVSYLISNYNPKGNWIGWLMMASIIVEAWDLYSIAFVLIFIRDIFHPSPAMLGLAAAGTQGGAIIGALLGGWLADRLGRRIVFLSTMGMFVIFALTQMLGVGTVALMSHAVGREDRREANHIFNQSVALSALCALVTLVGGYGLSGIYMRTMGADDASIVLRTAMSRRFSITTM